MAKDEVLYGYALLDDCNHIISIDDIDRNFCDNHSFRCPHCHNEMYATFGEKQVPHFRHNGDKCQRSKYLHDLAEYVFYEEYSRCIELGYPFYLEMRIPIRCNNACVLEKNNNCKEHYVWKEIELTQDYKHISLETRVDLEGHFRIPDVLLESDDGEQLWIEMWVSHETDEEKRKDGHIIEIKIDSENDLDMIRNHRIVQSKGDSRSVRLFNFDLSLPDPDHNLPCDSFYCFEVINSVIHDGIVDKIKIHDITGLSYRLVLRLNWNGRHNTIAAANGQSTRTESLKSYCIDRYYSYKETPNRNTDHSFDSLIVSEWKSASFSPTTLTTGRASRYPNKQQKPILGNTPSKVNVSPSIEWVDLGLPSGILWANKDAASVCNFFGAKQKYGTMLPSKEDAKELIEYCTRKWEEKTHQLIFTGPNGKCIAFPCKESNESYWLNDHEAGDIQFGQCFHIGPDKHLWINDKDVSSAIHVRCVKQA